MKHAILSLVLAVTAAICITGCSTLENKAFGLASNGTVMKVETTGSQTSGTIAPNVLFGTVQNSLATAPALPDGKKTQVVVAYTEAQSSMAAVFGHKAVTRTFTYIGNPSESAAETSARMDAVAKVLTSNDVQAETANKVESADSSNSAASSAAAVTATISSVTDSAGVTYGRASSGDNGTIAYAWTSSGDSPVTVYTASATPVVGDALYSNNALTTKLDATVASVVSK